MPRKMQGSDSTTRQMPDRREYMSAPEVPNKKERESGVQGYSDLVYGYLQVNSEWSGVEGEPRILPKRKAKFVDMSESLGISRQTVSKRFAELEARGLIYKDANGDIVLNILPKEIASLVNRDCLRQMVVACKDNTVNLYLYLYSRYKASGDEDFMFTYGELKRVIGVSDKTRSNDYIVRDILNVLMNLGLLELEVSSGDGQKTMFFVKRMSDHIPDKMAEVTQFC